MTDRVTAIDWRPPKAADEVPRVIAPSPTRLQLWLDTVDLRTRRAVSRVVVLLLVLPITLFVVQKLDDFGVDPYLKIYGILVTLGTVFVMYLAFVYYEDPGDRPLPYYDQLPTCSLLIPVKNEVDTIQVCVHSCMKQDYPKLEVLIVDDGSDDGTSELLDELVVQYGKRLRVLHLATSHGKKVALTRLAQDARGRVIAFTDSDCVLAPDSISRCVTALINRPQAGAASGHARALNADVSMLTKMQDVWYDGQFGVSKAAESVFGAVTCVSGPLAVYRREAIWNYLPAWANDTFLGSPFPFATDRQLTGYVLSQKWKGAALKAKHADDPMTYRPDYEPRRWEVVYVRSARVLTKVPEKFSHVIRQQVRWKKSFIRSLSFNGPYVWRLGPVPAFLYYAHVLWVLAAPFLVFRHLIWFPLHGEFSSTGLYLCGILIKGATWGFAFRGQNSASERWVYRPLMSLLSSTVLSWLIVYSAMTIRKSVWFRA